MLTASTRHIRAAKAVLILLGIAACFASPCFASPCFARPSFAVDRDAPPLPPLKVGVYIDPPFTMVSSGGFYSGYAIELWNLIEQKLGRSSTIENFKTFPEFLDAAATGKVDIAVGASFVTSDREKRMEFSFPIADGGLRISVNDRPKHSISRLWRGLIEEGHIEILAYGALILVGLSAAMMVVWRRVEKDFPSTQHDGFAEAFYRMVTLAMTGRGRVTTISTWYTKVVAAGWVVFGVAIAGYITASVTSIMTKNLIYHSVKGISDLENDAVGVVDGTLGQSVCVKRGISTVTFPTLLEACAALNAHTVTAVVCDGPLLEAIDRAHPEFDIREVGALFEKRKYAWPMPLGSPIRRDVNTALLELQESGEQEALRVQYFGALEAP